jgi:hypothetical protein
MKSFNEFYIRSERIFWAVNFAFAIMIVLLIGFTFNFGINEIFIQLGIAIAMTFLLVWILGGYKKIKSNYLERKSNRR